MLGLDITLVEAWILLSESFKDLGNVRIILKLMLRETGCEDLTGWGIIAGSDVEP
jgi:hypothetical protein